MERKNKIIFSLLIALVIAAAVFSSFGLTLLGGGTPEIVLPTTTPAGGGDEHSGGVDGDGPFVQVAVDRQTVQSVIATMERLPSYSRTITLEVSSGDAILRPLTAQVWVDGGWTRVEMSQAGAAMGTQYTIVGEGRLYRWYGSNHAHKSWPVDDEHAPDLAQHIPTYMDVLDLEPERIVEANYVERDGTPCVYVETSVDELGYLERFWISTDTGLLVAADTVKGDNVVLRMKSSAVNALGLEEMDFTLPDGTVLHQAAAN